VKTEKTGRKSNKPSKSVKENAKNPTKLSGMGVASEIPKNFHHFWLFQ
jgi:hypothetical protein